jgi:thioredoxin 1
MRWLALIVLLLGCNVPSAPVSPEPQRSQVTLVVFYATWCGPCQRAKPFIAQIEAAGVKVVLYNIDKDRGAVEKHHVTTVPTFLLMRDDQFVLRTNSIQVVLQAIHAAKE